jgi:hypothetical protein
VHVFSCTRTGSVEIHIESMDCDLDLYVLDDGCDPTTDCLAESVGHAGPDGTVEFDCVAGEDRFVVVEGYGFTFGAWEEYVAEPAARGEAPLNGWCAPEIPGLLGHYTLSVDSASPGCQEVCDNGADDDGDGATDCADSDCWGVLDCAPPETCDNGFDDDMDGLSDCADTDCHDEAYCCDDDGDGFVDIACGGQDCADDIADGDADADGVPDSCDVCPGFDDAADRDLDGIADGCDACPDAPAVDLDGDGASDCIDCDDTDPLRSPLDLDGDGHTSCDDDCNDFDAGTYPGAPERADGIDQDCDDLVDEGTSWSDDDGDGFSERGGDCNDRSSDVFPGAPEVCDGIDNDCDGETDEQTTCSDDDGDGYSEVDGDCHDGDIRVGPHALEIPYNGIDDDCDGITDDEIPDLDNDGFTEEGGDCGPTDPETHPAAIERPDLIDNDCDGVIDEETVLFDDDGDGLSEVQGDCHDGNANIAPGLPDDNNDGIDNDCDGSVDEDAPVFYPPRSDVDFDQDGFVEADDCDDNDGWAFPGAHEFCDGVDNDCDGTADEGCDARPIQVVSGACATGPSGGWWGFLLATALLRRRRS